METLFLDRNLLFNIVMNTDIEDLYKLYYTNHIIQNFINERYTTLSILKKYGLKYMDYLGKYDFIDIVWKVMLSRIGYVNENPLLKEEIFRVVSVIDNQFKSKNKITDCNHYQTEYQEWVCRTAKFLSIYGFKDMIDQIFIDIKDQDNQDEIYNTWLKSLKSKAIDYYLYQPNILATNTFLNFKSQ